VIFKLRKAITSTSANVSSDPSPSGFATINEEILKGVDYVVNWRQKEVINVKPSSIVKLELNGEIKFIRK
jgi:L-threonylcarbamoyladenylate synthase